MKALFETLKIINVFFQARVDSLPEGHDHLPNKTNDSFGRHEVKDVLAYLGIR